MAAKAHADLVDLTNSPHHRVNKRRPDAAWGPEPTDDRAAKKHKDEEAQQAQMQSAAGPQPQQPRHALKRSHATGFGEENVQETGATTIRLHLQASELQNSVKMLSCALRWRSPVKPYKMARTHASGPPPLPGAPTSGGPDVAGSRGAPSAPTHIVRGIHDTDFDMDTDHDHPEQHQAHHAASATGDSGNAGAGSGEAGAVGQPSVPADGKAVGDRGAEWRSLFSALALDDLLVGRAGGAGGSQRSDPVWGAASSNRCGGAAAKRVMGHEPSPALTAAAPKPPAPAQPGTPREGQPQTTNQPTATVGGNPSSHVFGPGDAGAVTGTFTATAAVPIIVSPVFPARSPGSNGRVRDTAQGDVGMDTEGGDTMHGGRGGGEGGNARGSQGSRGGSFLAREYDRMRSGQGVQREWGVCL